MMPGGTISVLMLLVVVSCLLTEEITVVHALPVRSWREQQQQMRQGKKPAVVPPTTDDTRELIKNCPWFPCPQGYECDETVGVCREIID